MNSVDILEARNNLSQLVNAAARGEEVVIAKRGRPVARLVPYETEGPSTGARIASWLEAPPPLPHYRTAAELDAQIEAERDGWE